jgi:hypothetical protein
MRLAQNTIEQRGFTRAEKAGEDGSGDQCHGVPVKNKIKDGG